MLKKESSEIALLKNMKDSLSDRVNRKLYLRFPCRVPEAEEIKKLNPDIVGVCYPRQKHARFCHIILKNETCIPEVIKLLNNQKYGDHGNLSAEVPVGINYIKIKEEKPSNKRLTEVKDNRENKNQKWKKSKKRKLIEQGQPDTKDVTSEKVLVKNENNDRRLWVKKLPISTEEKDLTANFPGCIWVKMYKNKASRFSCALCKFSTAQLAAAILSDPSKHKINGKNIIVKLAKYQQLRGRRKDKRDEAKNLKLKKQMDGSILRIKPEKADNSEIEMESGGESEDGSGNFSDNKSTVISPMRTEVNIDYNPIDNGREHEVENGSTEEEKDEQENEAESSGNDKCGGENDSDSDD